MSKIALPLKKGREIEVDADRILCNDIVLPCDAAYMQKTKLWVIWNEFGPMGAVRADNDQDALNLLVDSDLLVAARHIVDLPSVCEMISTIVAISEARQGQCRFVEVRIIFHKGGNCSGSAFASLRIH